MKKKILLVDDEEDILKVLRKRLEIAGYNVLVASSGKEALSILRKEIPELILLDIIMPDMDGIEVCGKIKKHKYMSNVPIIFFTARDSIEDKIKGLKQGVYDYITKPIDHRELLARLETILKIREHYDKISLKDNLTGLYNYNFFKKYYNQIFYVAKRYGRIFSLIVIDINNFKKINDMFGHLCGNFVLKQISEKLTTTLRKADVITRYGGDEFVVILPETGDNQATKLLERLRKALGAIQLGYNGHKIRVKLNFGLSIYSEEIKTKEDLFDIADKDMYKDKKRIGKKIRKEGR